MVDCVRKLGGREAKLDGKPSPHRLRLIFQEARQNLRRKIETGALKAFHRDSKIQEPNRGSFPQYAQCPHNWDAALFGLVPSLPVVNN